MVIVKVQNLQLHSYEIKLKNPLYIKNHAINKRRGFVLELRADNGQVIYTDIAPLPHFHPETCQEILAIFPKVQKSLQNSFWSLKLLLNTEHVLSTALSYQRFPSLYFAIEMAILCHLMPNLQFFQDIKVNAHLKGTDAEIVQKVQTLKSFSSLKVKVGKRNPSELLQLMDQLCPHLSSSQKLRIDFNRSYSLQELLTFCEKFPLELCEYLEEPLANPMELLAFASEYPHPIAYDESLLDTPLELLLTVPTKNAFVIKPTLIGSLQKIAYLYSKARLHNLQFVLTSTFESGLGHLMIAQLAHFFALEEAIGLDTYAYLENDILLKPLTFSKDTLCIKDQHIFNPYLNWAMLTGAHAN